MKNNLVHRIGLAVEEARSERSLSKSELARLAGVSRSTIQKLEGGGNVRPDLAVRVALAMTVVELYAPSPVVDDLAALVVPFVGAESGWAA